MYYNVYEGMQNTWSDRFGSITKPFTGYNWLPTAVGSLVILWVGLLFTAINQTGPANPGAPSDIRTSKSTPAMAVTTASDTSAAMTSPTSNSSTGTSSGAAIQSASIAPATSQFNTATAPDSTIGNVVGGRGADETTTPQTSPALSSPTNDTAAGATAGVGLTVQTPLTPDPISVGLGIDTGLQVDLGL